MIRLLKRDKEECVCVNWQYMDVRGLGANGESDS